MPSGFIASTMFVRVGTAARIVVDLGADREAHAAAETLAHDARVLAIDAGRLGRAVQRSPAFASGTRAGRD